MHQNFDDLVDALKEEMVLSNKVSDLCRREMLLMKAAIEAVKMYAKEAPDICPIAVAIHALRLRAMEMFPEHIFGK